MLNVIINRLKKEGWFTKTLLSMIAGVCVYIAVEMYKLGGAFVVHSVNVQADLRTLKKDFEDFKKNDADKRETFLQQANQNTKAIEIQGGQLSSLQWQVNGLARMINSKN